MNRATRWRGALSWALAALGLLSLALIPFFPERALALALGALHYGVGAAVVEHRAS